MNNTSAILSGTAFPSAFTMPQKVVDLLKGFVSCLVAMLTLPYPLIQRLSAHRTFTRFNTFNTNKLRAPFFIIQPFYRCLSPLNDWTDFLIQFRTLNLGNHEYKTSKLEC